MIGVMQKSVYGVKMMIFGEMLKGEAGLNPRYVSRANAMGGKHNKA